jgi:hypothetical protein
MSRETAAGLKEQSEASKMPPKLGEARAVASGRSLRVPNKASPSKRLTLHLLCTIAASIHPTSTMRFEAHEIHTDFARLKLHAMPHTVPDTVPCLSERATAAPLDNLRPSNAP